MKINRQQYFDYAASFPPYHSAIRKACRLAQENFGNPSSAHHCGQKAREDLENARYALSSACNFDEGKLIFTSGGTEANNLVSHAINEENPNGRLLLAKDVHSSTWEAEAAKKDNSIVVDNKKEQDVPEADNFSELYSRHGPLFLLADMPFDNPVIPQKTVRMAELDKIPASLKEKLRSVIQREDPYFILSGTDPRQPDGCCPSDEVGAANRLVGAGVLEKRASPTPPDACPNIVFAFRDEMDEGGDFPLFTTTVPTYALSKQRFIIQRFLKLGVCFCK